MNERECCGAKLACADCPRNKAQYEYVSAGVVPSPEAEANQIFQGRMPESPAARKLIPIFNGFFKYFPLAAAAVARLSKIGNEQHNPGSELHWDRTKSQDEEDALFRHKLDELAGPVDTDGVPHKVKAAWRAMADLQKYLEDQGARTLEVEAVVPVAMELLEYKPEETEPYPPVTLDEGQVFLRVAEGADFPDGYGRKQRAVFTNEHYTAGYYLLDVDGNYRESIDQDAWWVRADDVEVLQEGPAETAERIIIVEDEEYRFRVGDRVRVIDGEFHWIRHGSLGTVTRGGYRPTVSPDEPLTDGREAGTKQIMFNGLLALVEESSEEVTVKSEPIEPINGEVYIVTIKDDEDFKEGEEYRARRTGDSLGWVVLDPDVDGYKGIAAYDKDTTVIRGPIEYSGDDS